MNVANAEALAGLASEWHCSANGTAVLHAACPPLLWAPPFLEKGYKSVRFPMGPDPVCSLYPTGLHQTIPSAYPVPSIHLHVAFPKTRENGSSTDLLLIACKRDENQYTSATSV